MTHSAGSVTAHDCMTKNGIPHSIHADEACRNSAPSFRLQEKRRVVQAFFSNPDMINLAHPKTGGSWAASSPIASTLDKCALLLMLYYAARAMGMCVLIKSQY